jgi:hypothetical protein
VIAKVQITQINTKQIDNFFMHFSSKVSDNLVINLLILLYLTLKIKNDIKEMTDFIFHEYSKI